MKLFYGADKIIKSPIYGLGNPSNDYGLGLYLTPSLDAAKLWAERFQEGYVMTYEVDLDGLKVLTLDHATEEDVLTWLALLAKNRFDKVDRIRYQTELDWLTRKFSIDLSSYDVVIGYRADDSYFAYSSGFIKGEVSMETLERAMIIGKLGLQYVLLSPTAFQHLRYLKSDKISQSGSYQEFRKQALDEYHALRLNEDLFVNHFIRDIMRKYGK